MSEQSRRKLCCLGVPGAIVERISMISAPASLPWSFGSTHIAHQRRSFQSCTASRSSHPPCSVNKRLDLPPDTPLRTPAKRTLLQITRVNIPELVFDTPCAREPILQPKARLWDPFVACATRTPIHQTGPRCPCDSKWPCSLVQHKHSAPCIRADRDQHTLQNDYQRDHI